MIGENLKDQPDAGIFQLWNASGFARVRKQTDDHRTNAGLKTSSVASKSPVIKHLRHTAPDDGLPEAGNGNQQVGRF